MMKMENDYNGNIVSRNLLNLIIFSTMLVFLTSCTGESSTISISSEKDIDTNTFVSSDESYSTLIKETPTPSLEPKWTIPEDAPEWFNNEFIFAAKSRLEGIEAEFTMADGVPWGGMILHLAFVDLTDDGVPEILYGYHGVHNTDVIYYYIYSPIEQIDIVDSKGYLVTLFESISSTTILSDKYYIDSDGNKYFESVGDDYSGDMYIVYIVKIWRENSQWEVDYTCITKDVISHSGSYYEGDFSLGRGYENGKFLYDKDAKYPDGYKNTDESYPLITSVGCIDTEGDKMKLIFDCYQNYQSSLQ